MTCIALTFAFYVLPNTRVNLLYALIGGVISGIIWEGAKFGFSLYVASPKISLILKSLGAIPIFLIWIYFSWLIVLIGCELSFLLQNYRRLQTETFQKDKYTILDSKLVFLTFLVIADHFQHGAGSISFSEILSKVPIKADEMEHVLNLLIDEKFIEETSNNELIISRPLESVKPGDVLALGCDAHSLVTQHDADVSLGMTMSRLQDAFMQWSSDKSIRDLLPAGAPGSA
jgi:membrane protein